MTFPQLFKRLSLLYLTQGYKGSPPPRPASPPADLVSVSRGRRCVAGNNPEGGGAVRGDGGRPLRCCVWSTTLRYNCLSERRGEGGGMSNFPEKTQSLQPLGCGDWGYFNLDVENSVCVCVRVCVHACVRACVRVCVCACVCVLRPGLQMDQNQLN